MKELIFLDCLHQYYFGNRKQLLPDEDYEELKEQLTWEGRRFFHYWSIVVLFLATLLRLVSSGSVATTLSGKEAQFITAVAASRRSCCLVCQGAAYLCFIYLYLSLSVDAEGRQSWAMGTMRNWRMSCWRRTAGWLVDYVTYLTHAGNDWRVRFSW